jgi:hypothetical protein
MSALGCEASGRSMRRRCHGEKGFDVIEAEPGRLREVTGIGAFEPNNGLIIRTSRRWAPPAGLYVNIEFAIAAFWQFAISTLSLPSHPNV